RLNLRRQLQSLRCHRGPPSAATGLNYEAHQPPLAYVLMALTDRLGASRDLLSRVYRLRLLCGISASAMSTILMFILFERRLHLPYIFSESIVFVLLSSQIFYATTAHVAND